MDRLTETAVYKIQIQGHLDGRWSHYFEDMTITHLPRGITQLTGTVVDQATLHGLLSRIRDLGMILIAVERQDLHNDNSHIYLLQMPSSTLPERETLEWQMRQITGRGDLREAIIIDSQPCPIRGENTTLIISEGVNYEGQLYRSASAVFTGNEGTALVNISAPTNSWDQEMVERFIESLQ